MSELLKLSVTASTFSTDVREAARRSREEGFAGLVFDAYSSGFSFPDVSSSGKREIRQLLATHQQTLVALRADLGFKGFGPGADVDRLLNGISRAMEAVRDLGAQMVLIDLGPLPIPADAPAPKPVATPEQAGFILLPDPLPTPVARSREAPDPEFVSQVDAAMTELGRLADRFSVTAALGSTLAGFAALDRAIRAARCPWFGIDLDPVAIVSDDWNIHTIFAQLGPLIHHLRGRDAVAGADRRTKPMAVGRGGLNWNELFSALRAADYHGWITVEPTELPDRLAGARAGSAFLRAL